ncbi:hypothetical protein GCM10011349_23840 [Novosphingobium indicum]|uniref:PepSY domain-containing protein n=1 Tax=Novosphingobium indicum TaxID=462949 RepID=A0ABQ2JR37_9SPHN|nr:hypothetical protein [Novosphingobium indicum]GGN51344.1 hypothetical protein GCM10011349_23840 [Novosphingobium indicum]
MTKKFFTKVSPKAAKGIVRLYESKGYDVHAKPQANGDFVVVVIKKDSETSPRSLFTPASKRCRETEVAA